MQPCFGSPIALKQRGYLLPYFLMIRIHPRALVCGEESYVDEISPHRNLHESGWVARPQEGKKKRYYHRYTFESKVTLVAKVIRRLSLTHDDHVLDSYAIFPIGIVARLCLIVSFSARREGGDSHHSKQSYPVSTACCYMLWVKLRGNQQVNWINTHQSEYLFLVGL